VCPSCRSVLRGPTRGFAPSALTPKEFDEVVLSDFAEHNADECWGLYDLTHAGAVKAAFDRLAHAAARDPAARGQLESIRGSGREPKTMHYMLDFLMSSLATRDGPRHDMRRSRIWLNEPHFDAYDFARRASESKELSAPVRDAATELSAAVDQLVVHSFAGARAWPGFTRGANAAFFVFPDGAATLDGTTHWELMAWYTGADMRAQLAEKLAKGRQSFEYKVLREIEKVPLEQAEARFRELESQTKVRDEPDHVKHGYGRLSWAIDGAASENRDVRNWYELLRSWYGKQ